MMRELNPQCFIRVRFYRAVQTTDIYISSENCLIAEGSLVDPQDGESYRALTDYLQLTKADELLYSSSQAIKINGEWWNRTTPN